MKTFAAFSLLAAIGNALPVEDAAVEELVARQVGGSSTQTELENGACRAITFIFARASTERGNFGSSVGPPTCSGLKDTYGSDMVACQGVGGPYSADLASNGLPRGTSTAAINEGIRLFELAASKCPNSIVVAGGYSQGTALISAAISDLDQSTQNRIAGAVLYGNTRNAQNGGKIPNYPPENVLTICAPTDGVCDGSLQVTAGHFSYADDVPDAVDFLEGRIEAFDGEGGEVGGDVPADETSELCRKYPLLRQCRD
ncbi:uncharacterized protein LTR77_009754 [Saxophila tyrrhenica]|uniref:Cutinase n=1 Tax=Saxophila tyrrhenica TaxID=1690608 RepID=A0AAV9NXT4_9PEZI|nr:hypothetical protein LTR77_009754 [Saxophila tyrrhenica]